MPFDMASVDLKDSVIVKPDLHLHQYMQSTHLTARSRYDLPHYEIPELKQLTTTQLLFDYIGFHLLKQNRASRKGHTCLYRGPGNLKCAIGFIIHDRLYDMSFECQNLGHAGLRQIVESSIGRELETIEIHMLSDLQKIHDNVMVSDWRQHLLWLADKFSLRVNF